MICRRLSKNKEDSRLTPRIRWGVSLSSDNELKSCNRNGKSYVLGSFEGRWRSSGLEMWVASEALDRSVGGSGTEEMTRGLLFAARSKVVSSKSSWNVRKKNKEAEASITGAASERRKTHSIGEFKHIVAESDNLVPIRSRGDVKSRGPHIRAFFPFSITASDKWKLY